MLLATQARYFWLHGLWNMVVRVQFAAWRWFGAFATDSNLQITAVLLPDFFACIAQPHRAMVPFTGNDWSIIQVATLHIWHVVAYRGLTYDDWVRQHTRARESVFRCGGI